MERRYADYAPGQPDEPAPLTPVQHAVQSGKTVLTVTTGGLWTLRWTEHFALARFSRTTSQPANPLDEAYWLARQMAGKEPSPGPEAVTVRLDNNLSIDSVTTESRETPTEKTGFQIALNCPHPDVLLRWAADRLDVTGWAGLD